MTESLNRNLGFLVLEVTKQVERTQLLLDKHEASLVRKIRAKDDYIDQLKSTIENRCFKLLGQQT